MASPKLIKLLERLLTATKSGKVHWEDTAQEGVFRIILGDGLIRLESGSGRIEGLWPRVGDHWITAYLLDRKGQMIDQVSADSTDGNEFALLSELYQNARQSAHRVVDDVVDSMLAELEAK